MPSTSMGLTGATRQQIEYQAWLQRVTDPSRDWSKPTGAVPGVEQVARDSLRQMRRAAHAPDPAAQSAPGAPGGGRGKEERRLQARRAAGELSTRLLLLALADRAGRACAALFRGSVDRLLPGAAPARTREARQTDDAGPAPRR